MKKEVANPMKLWWRSATKTDKEKLAKLAETSVGQLGQLAGGHRVSGPAMARRIEIGTARIAQSEDLPIVSRTSLCPACGACEFAKKCKG